MATISDQLSKIVVQPEVYLYVEYKRNPYTLLFFYQFLRNYFLPEEILFHFFSIYFMCLFFTFAIVQLKDAVIRTPEKIKVLR
jgi:hypothetical protein